VRPPSTGWASEFVAAHPQVPQPAAWAQEFAGGASAAAEATTSAAWATEYERGQDQAAADAAQQGAAAAARGSAADTRSTSAALAAVLSQASDPKMRNSKFLQFVSKMSKGELILEDNKVGVGGGRRVEARGRRLGRTGAA
jgi:peroxin-5